MDFTSTPGPSSLSPYSLSPNYNSQDDSASPSEGEYCLGNIQSSELEEIRTMGEPSSHANHLPGHYGSEYSSIPHPVSSISNYQSRLYGPSFISSQGISLTVPASPFPTDPSQPGTPYPPSTQYAYPTGLRQTGQEALKNHNFLSPQDMYKVPVPFAPTESSLTMMASSSSSLPSHSYTQPGWNYDYDDATSFPCVGVEPESTTETPVAMEGQIATTQEASLTHRKNIQSKKGKDNARKQVVRSGDTLEAASESLRKINKKKEQDRARKSADRARQKRAHTRICELLDIDLEPDNTLADRILDGVEDITERLKSVDELQRRLDESEGCLHALRTVPVNNFSNGGDIGFFNGERTGHWA